MASNTTNDPNTLARIIHSDGIAKRLRENYPNVSDLLAWDLEKTASILCLDGAFQLFKLDQTLRYGRPGTDNYKTWSEYQNGIHQYLKTLNDDQRLEPARGILADHIHDVHLKKFPMWPSVGDQKQKSDIYIDISTSYPFGKCWYIGWSCLGFITVYDFRADASSYYTEFHGKPEFKILYCNEQKLKEFEELAGSDMDRAKELIKGNSLKLSWKLLEKLIQS